MEAALAAAVEALKFYAASTTYLLRDSIHNQRMGSFKTKAFCTEINMDKGKKARDALTKFDRLKNGK